MTKRKTPHYWNDAVAHLSGRDPVLKLIIGQYAGETLAARGDAFYTLARSIISQQISVKAAETIWGRVEGACRDPHPSPPPQGGGKRPPGRARVGVITPHALHALDEDALRACGLSRQKIAYMRSLAEFFLARRHAGRDWAGMSDEEVIKDLTAIKGIGRWTAEMFLIFHLLRPDVFPVADLGLQKAIGLHYGDMNHSLLRGERQSKGAQATSPNRAASVSAALRRDLRSSTLPQGESSFYRIAESWKPYRTVATWYLWRALDPVAVEY